MKSHRNRTIMQLGFTLLLIGPVLLAQEPGTAQKMKLPASQVMTASTYDFNDTVEILTVAIEEENMMVLKEIDAQKMLKMVNKKVGGMKQLLFFHPRYMKQIIETNRMGAIEPPLKVAIMERPDGKVMVKYIKPSYLLGEYPGLEALGAELDVVVQRITSSVKKSE